MDKDTITKLALVYVQLHATKELSPEQLIDLYLETRKKMDQYKGTQEELHGKWLY
jgi:hypothetical protein